MTLIAHDEFWWMEEHARLARKYLAAHENEQRGLNGFGRCLGWIRLRLAAWQYASQEIKQQKRDRRKLYAGR